jgi:methyltransferase-like protein/SAM-dependent methyltransferase
VAEAPQTSYDELPYEGIPFPFTHPEQLAMVATLWGLKPPPLLQCRVLELGCAGGGNLIPMAHSLPQAHFVGIDLSPRQVADGCRLVEALGLANIELKAQSILDVGADFGRFDYIICHGVYSWVPAEVQDKILSVCAANLADDGIAYVSFNTYPGWHIRGIARDLLHFHARQFPEPKVRVEQARAFLNFLIRSVGSQETAYAHLLKEEAELLASTTDSYLFHEHLEEVNQPVYLHEFMERAAAKGLQYVAEAKPSALKANLPPQARALVDQLPTPILQEQYLDFLCCGTFRRSLLCHRGLALRPAPSAEAVAGFLARSMARPESPLPDIHTKAEETFKAPNDRTTLATNRPLVKAALAYLFEVWPRVVPVGALWEEASSRLARPPRGGLAVVDGDPQALAEILLQLYQGVMVELHTYVPPFRLEAGERPVASPVARLQAAEGVPVANLRHLLAELDDLDHIVLPYLDGSRDRAALLELLTEAVLKGDLNMEQDGKPLRDRDTVRQLLTNSLEPCLQRLATGALLVE